MEGGPDLTFGSIPGKQTVNGEWTGPNAFWYIEEKVDGSQLSFAKKDGILFFANRGTYIKQPPPWLFAGAMIMLSTLTSLIPEGYVFHGECVSKLKHNVCKYGRVPKYQFILFGVKEGDRTLDRSEVETVAKEIGLECVQLLWQNDVETTQPAHVVDLILRGIEVGAFVSMLGGDKPEGIVFKHYARVKKNNNKKTTATQIKVVRKEFKEKHAAGGGERPVPTTQEEKIAFIMSHYSREVRWQKATHRLRDRGVITGEPENAIKERGQIMAEARLDFEKEEAKHLKDMLWAMYGQMLVQSITDGMGVVPEK